MLILRQATKVKIVMTTSNYFAQGRRTLPSSPSTARRTALQIPISKQRRAANRPVQIGESRLQYSGCWDARARIGCSDSKILDKREIYIRGLFIRHPRAETSLCDVRRSRGSLGIRNSRNPSARVNGPPFLPPALLSPLPQSRARSIFHLAPPRDGSHAIEQFFFEHRAKQVFDRRRCARRREGRKDRRVG